MKLSVIRSYQIYSKKHCTVWDASTCFLQNPFLVCISAEYVFKHVGVIVVLGAQENYKHVSGSMAETTTDLEAE